MSDFCVPEPYSDRHTFLFQYFEKSELSLLASNVPQQYRRGRKMKKQFSIETAICAEHQRLLEECERALEILNEHRAEFCGFRSVERKAGDELLRLQAKYARAYTVLQNHKRHCLVCQLVSNVEGRDSEESADTLSDHEMSA